MQQKPSLKFTVTTDADRAEQILTLKGKLVGTSECYSLLDDTRERVQDGLKVIILDMSAVDLINSNGCGILAAMITSAGHKEGKVCLVGLNDRNRQVLEIMQLHQFATLFESMEQARAAEA